MPDYRDFLQSNGFVNIVNNVISFTHQSILDIFLSEHMAAAYYSNKGILEIIGDKKKQIPGKRYQMQLFMEQLLEFSESDFIKCGKKILESADVRFSFKYVFIELLAVLSNPSVESNFRNADSLCRC